MPPSEKGPVWRYGLALLVVAAAVAVKLLTGNLLGSGAPFLLMLLPVLIASLYGGLGPGVLATALTSIAVAYFFLGTPRGFTIGSGGWQLTGWFALESALVCAIAVAVRRHLRSSELSERRARTDERLASDELARSEERFRSVFEHAPVGMALTDLEGRFIHVNEAYCRIIGYDASELIGSGIGFPTLTHPADRAMNERELRRLIAGETPAYFQEKRYIRKDGSPVWVRASVTVRRNADGRPFQIVRLVEDISGRKEAELAVDQALERYRLAARATNDAIWDLDLTTGRVEWNRAMAELFGWPEPDHPRDVDWWRQRVHPDDLPRVRESMDAAVSEGSDHWGAEYRFRRADGSYADVHDRGYMQRDASGRTVRMVGAMADITERKRAEESVHASRAMLQAVLDNIPQGVFWKDRNSVFMGVNTVAAKATGFDDPAAIVGRSDLDLDHVPPEQVEHFRRIDREVMESGVPRLGIIEPLNLPDGSTAWLETNKAPLRDAQGRIIGVLGTWQDITARRKIEMALSESEAKYRTLFESMDEGFCIVECVFDENDRPIDFRFVEVNPAFQRQTGLADVAGKSMRQLGADPDGPWFERYGSVALTGRPVRFESRATRLNRWYDVYAWRHGAPENRRVAILFNDITERKENEDRLRESEQRFKTMANTAPAMLWIADEHNRSIFFTRGWYEFTGQAEEQALGMGWAEAVHPEDRERAVRTFLEAAEKRESFAFDYRLRTADGEHRWVINAGRPRFDDDGAFLGYIGSVIDVHERVQAEQALRESEERFRQLADSMPQLVWTARPDGSVDYYNRHAMALSGLRRLPDGTWTWEGAIHPDDAEPTERAWRDALAAGAAFQVEHRIRGRDGEYHWRLSRAVPVRDAAGRIVKWYGTATDIDEIKAYQAELTRHRDRLEDLVRERTMDLEQTHQRLRLSERLASLGTLSAGIGHDLGNLLLPIRARLDSMPARGLPSQFNDDLIAIGEAAQYLQSLANGLRLLSGDPETGADDLTDLARWWNDARPMLKNALPSRVALECNLPEDLPRVRASATGLTQAIFNLVQNAGNAIGNREGGRIRIWAEREPSGERVRVGVTDNGPGMTPEVRDRCLEPFFTTKIRSISTGMGLSLVHGFVRRVGGELSMDTLPGRGTTFVLALPAEQTGPDGAAAERPLAVLSVRDPRLRGYASTILETMGFESKVADRPAEDRARLWLADAANDDEVVAFVQSHPAARAVLLGAPAHAAAHPRVVVVREAFQPGAVRGAIRSAMRAERDEEHAAHRGRF